MLESLEGPTKEKCSAHRALGSPLYRWFEAPWGDHKLPVRVRLGEWVFWSRAGWECDLLQLYFHGNRIRAGTGNTCHMLLLALPWCMVPITSH